MKLLTSLVLVALPLAVLSHDHGSSMRVERPWCFDGHIHYHLLDEIKMYYDIEGDDGFNDASLDSYIQDVFGRLQCSELNVDGVDCCTEALTAANIYAVLGLDLGTDLESRQFQQTSTIILNWAFQLEKKCAESPDIDWDTLKYSDIVHELMHSFEDEDDDDDHDHRSAAIQPKHDHDHDHDYFTAVNVEQLMRTMDEDYTPGIEEMDPYDKDAYCNRTGAWEIQSRRIWVDLHLHHEEDGITEGEMAEMSSILLLHVIHDYCFLPDRILEDNLPLEEDFILAVFNKYGDDCEITEHGFEHILEDIGAGDDDHHHHHSLGVDAQSGHDHDHDHDHDHGPYSDVTHECYDSHKLQDTFHIDLHHENLTREHFLSMAPALIQQAIQGCQHHHSHPSDPISDAEKWGYSFLCVLIISCSSLLGLIVSRWSDTDAYKYAIVTMLGLASGTLLADVLLHLIPHSVGLHDHDHHHDHAHDISELEIEEYVWKMLVACISLWAFFVLQLVLIDINEKFGKNKVDSGMDAISQGRYNNAFNTDEEMPAKKTEIDGPEVVTQDSNIDKQAPVTNGNHVVSGMEPEREPVEESVAWLAVAGDGVHKLADGLAIGAAFSSSVSMGFSTAIAVFCHEVPHEMGDIAIMLSAGWKVSKVALIQILTTLAAFLGLVIGIPVSSNEDARNWIFIVASGMFLYVSLVSVMPEMIRTYRDYRKKAILAAANIGFGIGIAIMLVIAIFEEYITV